MGPAAALRVRLVCLTEAGHLCSSESYELLCPLGNCSARLPLSESSSPPVKWLIQLLTSCSEVLFKFKNHYDLPGRPPNPRCPGIGVYFPDPGQIGIGKIPAIFPAKSGGGGAGFGDLGVCSPAARSRGAANDSWAAAAAASPRVVIIATRLRRVASPDAAAVVWSESPPKLY